MPKFKTQYNQDKFPDQGEVNRGVSMTRPDMGLSIRDLLDRQTRGIPVDGGKLPLYDEEDPDDAFYAVPNWGKMDLAEREELARAAKEEVDRLRSILNEKAAEVREEKEKAEKAAQRKQWEEQQDAEDKRLNPRRRKLSRQDREDEIEDQNTNLP